MKGWSLSIILCFTIQIGLAQYGITSQFVSGKSVRSDSDLPLEDQASGSTTSGYLVGFNYWLRLKNIRLEFFPGLNYSSVTAKESLGLQPALDLKRWELILPASFYLLDFKGDCHCPTFSKQNDLVKKGLFFQVLALVQREQSGPKDGTLKYNHQNLGAGVGIGLDIGLSDFLTLTPVFQYVNHLSSTRAVQNWGSTEELRAGIRFVFRPDYR